MRLYMFPVAPNPTKVRLYLAEKRAAGCPIELEEVTVNLPKGEQNDERFIQINPMGALPVLETDAGTVHIGVRARIDRLDTRIARLWAGPRIEKRHLSRDVVTGGVGTGRAKVDAVVTEPVVSITGERCPVGNDEFRICPVLLDLLERGVAALEHLGKTGVVG